MIPEKNLCIDSDGRIYGNYYTGQPIGRIFNYNMRSIEVLQPKSYLAIRKDLKELEKAQSAFETALSKVFAP